MPRAMPPATSTPTVPGLLHLRVTRLPSNVPMARPTAMMAAAVRAKSSVNSRAIRTGRGMAPVRCG